MGVLSQGGRRVWGFLRPEGPTWTVRSSRASLSSRSSSSCLGETKSAKEGPLLRRSLKVLAGRGWVDVVDGGGGSLIVVAKRLFCGMRGVRGSRMVEVSRRRAGGRRAAIVRWLLTG